MYANKNYMQAADSTYIVTDIDMNMLGMHRVIDILPLY